MIRCESLSVAYEGRIALLDASVEVRPASILGIAGPNGAGKSTLIQAMLGLVKPLSGQVTIGGVRQDAGRAFRKAAAQIAYVPQKQSVAVGFPITVREVVGMGQYAQLGWFARRSAQQVQAIDHALDALELTALQDRAFSALSGGQQQKTLVARALAQGARAIVLDEPFRGVDAKSQRAMMSVLDTHRRQGGSVVLVHHGANVLEELCDDLLLVNRSVVAFGSPAALLADPKLVAMLTGDAMAAEALVGEALVGEPFDMPLHAVDSSVDTAPLPLAS